jgi:hypothetical protein
MTKRSIIGRYLMVGSIAAAAVLASPLTARADVNSCTTRTVSATYSGTTWMSQNVCQTGEFALAAGGFCSAAGDRKGVSTTAGVVDRQVWLWCNQSGNAIWYAVCCKP